MKAAAPDYPTRSDLDNYTKFVMDCLNKRLFREDRQVIFLSAEKRFSQRASEEIELREISEGESPGLSLHGSFI